MSCVINGVHVSQSGRWVNCAQGKNNSSFRILNCGKDFAGLFTTRYSKISTVGPQSYGTFGNGGVHNSEFSLTLKPLLFLYIFYFYI